MISKISHIIFLIGICCSNILLAQTAGTKINPDSLNFDFLESLIKTKIDSVRLVNNKKALADNDTLKKAASDQINYVKAKKQLTHLQSENPEKKFISDRLKYYGIVNTYTGENLVMTYIFTKISNRKGGTYINITYKDLADDIINLWVKSKGHFKNIINEEYTMTAVAVSYDKSTKTIYAAQVFSSK
jgi:uncharacterized protein YkwD